MDGGIFGLLGLIRVHRGAVEYDLRHRFGLGLRDIGNRVTIAEVARLITICRADPGSATAAAVEGWDFPISRESLALYDLYDLTVQAHSDTKKGRPKPRAGRPFKVETGNRQRFGNTGGRTRAEVVEILNGLGHSLPA